MSRFPVRKICNKNKIDIERIKENKISPEDTCKKFEIKSTSERIYLLSFYLDRKEPVNLKTNKEKVKSEIFFYKNADVTTPTIVDSDKEKYLLVKKMKGDKTINKFRLGNQKSITKETAHLCSKIHKSKKFAEFGKLTSEENVKSWKKYFEKYINVLNDSVETDLEKKSLTFLEKNLFLLEKEFDSVLIHGDLHPWNTINLDSGDYGVVDGEGCLAAPRDFDLAQSMVAWSDKFSVTDVFLKSYRSENNLKEGWEDRLDYYRVFWLLSAVINGKSVGWTDLVDEFEPRLERRLEDV